MSNVKWQRKNSKLIIFLANKLLWFFINWIKLTTEKVNQTFHANSSLKTSLFDHSYQFDKENKDFLMIHILIFQNHMPSQRHLHLNIYFLNIWSQHFIQKIAKSAVLGLFPLYNSNQLSSPKRGGKITVEKSLISLCYLSNETSKAVSILHQTLTFSLIILEKRQGL